MGWPVATGLLLCAAGLAVAYARMNELWWLEGQSNLDGSPVDGFAVAILALAGTVVVALARPHLAPAAVGATGGIGLFFVTWGYAALGVPSHTEDRRVRQAVVAVPADRTRRRRPVGSRPGTAPGLQRTRHLGAAAGTSEGAARRRLGADVRFAGAADQWPRRLGVAHGRFLAVPVVAVALALLAATADLRLAGAVAGGARLPAVGALAYLAPTTLAAGYLAGSAASPFGLALAVGAVCLGVPAVTRVRPLAGDGCGLTSRPRRAHRQRWLDHRLVCPRGRPGTRHVAACTDQDGASRAAGARGAGPGRGHRAVRLARRGHLHRWPSTA